MTTTTKRHDNTFAVLLVLIATIIPLVFVRGFVLGKLWAWFVVPAFGLPQLSAVALLGLSTLLEFVQIYPHPKPINTFEDVAAFFGRALGRSGSALLMGWILTLFL